MYCYVHSLISHYLTHDQQITFTPFMNETFFVLQDIFVLFKFESKYFKYLESGPKFESNISNNM